MRKKLLLVMVSMTIFAQIYGQQNLSPLCFTAKNGSVTVSFTIRNVTHTIQYSTDCTNWDTYTSNTSIALNANQSVFFRAESNQTTATAFGGFLYENSSSFEFSSSGNGVVEGSGNIMSLYGRDCPDLALQNFAFAYMFYDCTLLTAAPELPATTLASSCYSKMFYGCTSLAQAPSLPATVAENTCYWYMFYGCTSLAQAPSLPATTLAEYCYWGMFYGCTSLAQAPSLPATTLEEACYMDMFYGCTSLAQAPSLPATTLTEHCYCQMFYGCNSLTQAPSLPATTMVESCYMNMFHSCTSLAQVPSLPATVMKKHCYAGMFQGCTSLKQAPSLPATTLAEGCYAFTFNSCSALKTAPALPATVMEKDCYCSMFQGCTSLRLIPSLPATTLAEGCYFLMFSGCSSLIVNTEAPGEEWQIPSGATAATDWNRSMFEATGGTFKGAPEIGVTYYIDTDTSTTALKDVEEAEYIAYTNDREIIVSGAEGKMVRVYDLNGRLVCEVKEASNTQALSVNFAGVYIVRIDERKSIRVVVG